jgi:iron complex outermembrane receptor protein
MYGPSKGSFETLFPLMDNLEMNIAGRYDRYSDYGSDFSPKISFRYQPTDALTVRASYGQGFRAPTLDILTQRPAFSAAGVVHAPTAAVQGVPATRAIQITTFSIANPNLESEQSDQYTLGVAFEPTLWFSGSVDYFNIKVDNQITQFSAQAILNCLEGTSQNCPTGLSRLTTPLTEAPNAALGLGMNFGSQGEVLWGQTGFGNLGTLETDGLDVNLRTAFDLGAGRLTNNLQITYVNSYKEDGNDVIGEAQYPQYRWRLENVYAFGDFSVAWNMNFIAAQDTSMAGPPAAGQPDPGVDSWLTHDLQFNWFTPWNARLTLGAVNVTDEDPPLDNGEGRGFNFNLYDGYGRVPYLRYTQSF